MLAVRAMWTATIDPSSRFDYDADTTAVEWVVAGVGVFCGDDGGFVFAARIGGAGGGRVRRGVGFCAAVDGRLNG